MAKKTLSLSADDLILSSKLRQMRLSGMADVFEKQMQDPNADLSSFTERITEIIETEWQLRYDKKFNRYLKVAKLRYPFADLDETIYQPERKLNTQVIERLNECTWIDEAKNLLITGLTSSGKTYLSNALCISAMRQFKTVRYIRANILI